MATTVPTAVPEPDDGPAKGGLIASALAPVTPARTTFDLTPENPADATTEAPVTGLSSASYHDAENTDGTQNSTAGSRQKQGIWRAWLLAGAARWAKGGGAHNKRLEVAKAKAQARQVKENRQVSVNRTDGIPSRSSNTNSGGGKSLNSKSNGNGATRNNKNSNGNPHTQHSKDSTGNGSSQHSNSRTRDNKPSNDHQRPRPTDKPASNDRGTHTRKDSSTPSPKPSKGDSGSRTTPSKDTSKGSHGRSDTPTGGGSNPGTGKGTSGAQGSAGSPGKPGGTSGSGGGSTTPGRGSKGTDKVSLTKPRKDKGHDQHPAKDKKHKAGKDQPTAASKDAKAPNAPKPSKDGKQPKPSNGRAEHDKTPLREARETGYRDGARAALAAAHVKAYRDGLKDGWTDTTAAAEREKKRLDKARETRQKQLEQQRKDKPVTAPATSADYHQPQTAQPIEVTGIDADNLQLGDGAARQNISRGEVRTLKAFERRFDVKSRNMLNIAEGTKSLKAQAENYAKEAGRLMEAVQTMQAGEKLTACLAKLHESAAIQAGKAEVIQTRATRAAEACKVLLTNVETRYGDMYKAVVDSDEALAAKFTFYKD